MSVNGSGSADVFHQQHEVDRVCGAVLELGNEVPEEVAGLAGFGVDEECPPADLGQILRIVQDRMGATAEVAEVVAYLASDQAAFITGVALPIDNGFTARLF